MLRVTFFLNFSKTMIILNLIFFFCCSSALARLNYLDRAADIIKNFRGQRALIGKPLWGKDEATTSNLQTEENKVEDQITDSTAYGVRAVDNRRRRARRHNNKQFLGPMRNMFGGNHKKQRPYKRLPPNRNPRFRVGVHTPSEVRAY